MEEIKTLIRTISDFPKPGIEFRDLTTLFLQAHGFSRVVESMAEQYRRLEVDLVAGVESRGFLVAAPLAVALGKGLVPIRKPGKLPGSRVGVDYALEYGMDRLEIHDDAFAHGARVLVVDDLLATGGTMEAACTLVERVGGTVVGCAVVVELVDLKGRERLKKYAVSKLVEFDGA